MHDATPLRWKFDEHTQVMIHHPDGTIDAYACEARAWMFAGMQELIALTTADAELMAWLEAQEVALIDQANQARRRPFTR